MSGVKHTPGPWRVEAGTTLIWGNCNPDDHSTRGMGYPIAEARINPSGNWSTGPYADEGEANARLIAAAPDLLEALESIVLMQAENRGDGVKTHLALSHLCVTAQAAIARARGES